MEPMNRLTMMAALTGAFSDHIPKGIVPESRIRQLHGACRAIGDQLAGARSDNRIRKLRDRLERSRREGLRLELEQRGPCFQWRGNIEDTFWSQRETGFIADIINCFVELARLDDPKGD